MSTKETPSAAPSRKRRIVWTIVLSTLLVLGAGLGWFFWYFGQVPVPAAYTDPGSIAERQENTNIMTALAVMGVRTAFVNTSATPAYIGYELPNGTEAMRNLTASGNYTVPGAALTVGNVSYPRYFQLLVLGVALGSTNAEKVQIVQHIDGEPTLVWTADTKTYKEYVAQNKSFSAFEATLVTRAITS